MSFLILKKSRNVDNSPWIRSVELDGGVATVTDTFTNAPGTVLNYMMKYAPRKEGNKLFFPSGICVELDGVDRITIEPIDVTGSNPPDGIIADAENRTDMRSYLIPRFMKKQWGKDEIYKLTATPSGGCVTLRAYKI